MKRRSVQLLRSSATNLLVIVLGVGMLYPIAWLISAAFKPSNAIFTSASLIPKEITFRNFSLGWKGIGIVGFDTFFLNSFVICALCVVANVVFCSLTAYAFGRLRFAGRSIWFAVMLLTMMLPAHVTTIPRYIIFRSFGWLDSFLPIVAPKMFATDAFFIFLLVQFIRGIPKELDESALIDGYGKWGIYSKIIMPLTVPALITTVLFTFLWTWDDFFNQLLYLNSPPKYTVPMGLRLFIDSSGISSWGPMFAMSVLSTTGIKG
jgi:multiple sugar transport system permease protein